MSVTGTTATAEWKAYWAVPIAGALGYATSVIHIYGLSPFIVPVSEEFGWSRTETTTGFSIAIAIQAFFGVVIGFLVDRFGPRLFGIIGVLLTCGAYALLSTATGSMGNWIALWVVMAAATLPVQATIWTSAVASRFEVSRGMAFAVTLCGASLAIVLFPRLAIELIERFDWRTALVAQAGIWAAIAFPIIFFFFKGARDDKQAQADPAAQAKVVEGMSFLEGLKSSIYIRLLVASLLFTFVILGWVVHFVPMMTDIGVGLETAGWLASVLGIFSMIGRFGTGFLLDRMRSSLVGAGVFMLPVLSAVVLMLAGGSFGGQLLAAALIGLTLGAEVDVIVYLTTRHFGLKSFGALYGGLLAALSVGTSVGPLAAAGIYDEFGSYGPFMWVTVALMILSAAALVTLPKPAFGTPKG